MVLKKPYAFLIKNFKWLHIILAIIMIYLSIRINLITNLFNNLANSVNVSLLSISDKYLNGLMYLAIILILTLGFAIWFLMHNKKKPNKYYIAILIYYILLFVFLIIYDSAIESLEKTAMTNQALRAYRDIAFLFPLGQYYFIVVAVLRGIGFNIKQFNFSKDIKELDISEEDSEEIELKLSSNIYKYERAGRKKIRELKYYFFENKFWILIISGIILLVGIIYFFVNYRFVNNNYGEGTFVSAGKYNFQVNKTIIAEKNLYGDVVQEGKKYVIVDLSIRNNYYENIGIDINNFRLFRGNDYYYSITNKNSAFVDIGQPYDNKYLDMENVYNYILIYELDENVSTRGIKLKVYDSLDQKTNKANYVNIKLKPIEFKDEITLRELEVKEDVILDEENYGKTQLNVKNYQIINNYEYTYKACVNDDCTDKTGVISPQNILKNKLISIDYSLKIDKDSNLYNFVKNDGSFYNTFATLTYTLNGKKKSLKFNSITNSNINGKVFVEVSNDIDKAEEIQLIINTRKVKYVYRLK